MKKLMIAATMLASTVAMADLCDEVVNPGTDGCTLYDVQFKFKTLAGKDARCSATELASIAGQNGGNNWTTPYQVNGVLPGIAYLDNTTRTFNGVLWQCHSACFEGVTPGVVQGDPNAANYQNNLNYALWDKKGNRMVSPQVTYTYTAATKTADWASAVKEDTKFDILGRYGKNATKVAAYWKPTMLNGQEEIVAAGFGTYDTKKQVIKSVSGNAVGKLIPVVVMSNGDTCNDGTAMPSVLAYMCNNFKGWCCGTCIAAAVAPASGTWSIKYNASKSKNGRLSQILPYSNEANGLKAYNIVNQ